MNVNDNPVCERAELVRDYAFDELAAAERKGMEQHFRQCSSCAAELDGLRLTTAALRVLPDVEVPRRIAFVSDKVIEQGWFGSFWNSAARLGFAAACVLAVGLSFAAWHRASPGASEGHTVVQTGAMSQADIDAAVNRAVALAVDKAHADDVRMTQAALAEVDSKYAEKNKNLMIQVASSLEFLQKRNQLTARASYVDGPTGVTQ